MRLSACQRPCGHISKDIKMDILITAVLNLLVSLDDLRIFESHKIQKKSPKGHIQTYFYLCEQVNPLCTLHLTSEDLRQKLTQKIREKLKMKNWKKIREK